MEVATTGESFSLVALLNLKGDGRILTAEEGVPAISSDELPAEMLSLASPEEMELSEGGEALRWRRGGEGGLLNPVLLVIGVVATEAEPRLQEVAVSALVGVALTLGLLKVEVCVVEGVVAPLLAPPSDVPPLITVVEPYVGVEGVLTSIPGLLLAAAMAMARSGLNLPTNAAALGFKGVDTTRLAEGGGLTC